RARLGISVTTREAGAPPGDLRPKPALARHGEDRSDHRGTDQPVRGGVREIERAEREDRAEADQHPPSAGAPAEQDRAQRQEEPADRRRGGEAAFTPALLEHVVDGFVAVLAEQDEPGDQRDPEHHPGQLTNAECREGTLLTTRTWC